jgi:hypothetical protein
MGWISAISLPYGRRGHMSAALGPNFTIFLFPGNLRVKPHPLQQKKGDGENLPQRT